MKEGVASRCLKILRDTYELSQMSKESGEYKFQTFTSEEVKYTSDLHQKYMNAEERKNILITNIVRIVLAILAWVGGAWLTIEYANWQTLLAITLLMWSNNLTRVYNTFLVNRNESN